MCIPSKHDEPGNDAAIKRMAEHCLRWSPSLSKTDIQVSVRDGCVALSGEVGWDHQILAAEAAVRHIFGVSAVTTSLRVRAPTAISTTATSQPSAPKPPTRIPAFADLRGELAAPRSH